jgi:hypothetical protein
VLDKPKNAVLGNGGEPDGRRRPVIVVVAAPSDATARALVARWEEHGARLLTVADLTAPGWRVYTEDPERSRAVVGGEVVATEDIAGVVMRLPAITAQDVPVLAAEDRAYAATEMTAFLLYWLSSLSCPVLNRPSAPGLCGPAWRSEQWAMTAARLGLDAEVRRRRVPAFERDAPAPSSPTPAPPAQPPSDVVEVAVVGDRCPGTDDEELARQARLLAGAAGAETLTVCFAGSRFLDATRWVDVRDDEVADALLHRIRAGARPPATGASVR